MLGGNVFGLIAVLVRGLGRPRHATRVRLRTQLDDGLVNSRAQQLENRSAEPDRVDRVGDRTLGA